MLESEVPDGMTVTQEDGVLTLTSAAAPAGLDIRQEPIAWGFSGTLPTADIASIGCESHRSTRKSASGVRSRHVSSWSVVVRTRAGDEHEVLFNLQDAAAAGFVARRLSAALGLGAR